MKGIHRLIKGCLDHLGISTGEFRTLVETSENYDGDDYNRRIISDMIKLAEENEGVPQTQILAKWDLYLIEIQEFQFDGAEKEFSETVKEKIRGYKIDDSVVLSLGYFDEVVSTLDGYAERNEDVDWHSAEIDFDIWNAQGIVSIWGESVLEEIQNGKSVTLYVHLDENSPAGKASISQGSAKQAGYGKFMNEAHVALYRIIRMVEAVSYSASENIRVVIHTNSSFWGSEANRHFVEEFLNNVEKVEGFYCSSGEFNSHDMTGNDDTLIVFDEGEGIDDLYMNDLHNERGVRLFYTNGEIRAVAELVEDIEELPKTQTYTIDANGDLGIQKPTHGAEKAVGYFSVNGIRTIENYPRSGSTNIPIVTENIEEIIPVFSLTQSLSHRDGHINWQGVSKVMDGMPGYKKLVANCLPVFLYSRSNNRRDRGIIKVAGGRVRLKNELSLNNVTIKGIVDKYKIFMDFEALSLFDFCSEMEEESGKLIQEIISENDEISEQYDYRYEVLLSHLNTNYDRFVL